MIQKIDKHLLRFFQKISDVLQQIFGVTSFWVAQLFLGISFLSAILATIQGCYVGKRIPELIVGICILTIFTLFIWLKILEGEEVYKNNPRAQNPNVMTIRFWRTLELLVLVGVPGNMIIVYLIQPKEAHKLAEYLLWDLQQMSLLFSMYFTSCTPKAAAIKESTSKLF